MSVGQRIEECRATASHKLSQKDVELEIFGLEDLKTRLSGYINNRLPFVLSYTDLRLSNIIVNENLRI